MMWLIRRSKSFKLVLILITVSIFTFSFFHRFLNQNLMGQASFTVLSRDSLETHTVENKPFNRPTRKSCSYDECFQFSRCSLTKPFKFHVHQPISNRFQNVYENLRTHEDYASSISEACVYIVLLSLDQYIEDTTNYLQSLPTWRNSGTNHVIVLHSDANCLQIQAIDFKNAVLVSTINCHGYLPAYDMLTPHDFISSHEKDIWKHMLPLVPLERKYLLHFDSHLNETDKTTSSVTEAHNLQSHTTFSFRTQYDEFLRNCVRAGWCTGGPKHHRTANIKISKFNLIIAGNAENYFFSNIIESFKYGSIPVIIGGNSMLPFANVIDWSRACVILSRQRLPDLHNVITSIPLADVVSLKRQGRFLYETYFSTKEKYFNMILGYVRHNLGIPPSIVKDNRAILFNNSLTTTLDTNQTFLSTNLTHNFSYLGKSKLWNRYPGALKMYPATPRLDSIPSRMQHEGDIAKLYQPLPQDQRQLSGYLGGNHPGEQFTMVMLVYDRQVSALKTLKSLIGMKLLHKAILIWNHPNPPSSSLVWPDTGFPTKVVRAEKNSLNNRYIPYDLIETEAVFIMDDDVELSHAKIETAFRVWRENRDQLVGYVSRHHGYNAKTKSFYYEVKQKCEASMVLTNAAFLHKYYMYLYTHDMYPAIREKIDEYMNCDDIAFNFLVAHVTHKPPIKITHEWDVRCTECRIGLSGNRDHFEERNKCMIFFEKVYGYNPLKRTQAMSESILGERSCFS